MSKLWMGLFAMSVCFPGCSSVEPAPALSSDPVPAATPPATPAALPSTASASDKSFEPIVVEGIEQVGDAAWTVGRAEFDGYLKNLEGLSREARMLIHRGVDGQPDGYRVSAIRRGGLFRALGLENGDVLHAINEEPVSSVEQAMKVYELLQEATNVRLDLSRSGERLSLEYAIQ